MSQFRSNRHAKTGCDEALGAFGAGGPVNAEPPAVSQIAKPLLRAHEGYVHMKTFFRIDPCTPQLASTTWVTPKSAATDISAIASSSLMR